MLLEGKPDVPPPEGLSSLGKMPHSSVRPQGHTVVRDTVQPGPGVLSYALLPSILI